MSLTAPFTDSSSPVVSSCQLWASASMQRSSLTMPSASSATTTTSTSDFSHRKTYLWISVELCDFFYFLCAYLVKSCQRPSWMLYLCIVNGKRGQKGCLPSLKQIMLYSVRDNPYRGKNIISMTQKDYPDSTKEISPSPQRVTRLQVYNYFNF